MAIVSGTFLTFAAKGLKEELSDVIYNISPETTPLTSMAAKERGSAVLTEWQLDALAAVDTSNKQLEGDDITSFTAVVPTTRVGNYQQISRKDFVISGTEEEVNKAGRRSEIAYQTAKKGSEIRRDMEAIVFENLAGDAGSATVARQTATLGAWLKSNVNIGSGGGNPTYTSGVPGAARTDGTLRAFTETILKDVLQQMWVAGAELKFVFVGPVNKQKVSAFAGIATATYNISGRRPGQSTIVGAADIYESDFGTLEVVPSRFQRERDAYCIDPNFLAISHLRPFRRVPLAKTGDAEKRMMLVEWALKMKNEAAQGLAADLTTT